MLLQGAALILPLFCLKSTDWNFRYVGMARNLKCGGREIWHAHTNQQHGSPLIPACSLFSFPWLDLLLYPCMAMPVLTHKAKAVQHHLRRVGLDCFGHWLLQDMDLASHPSLEGSLETGVEFAMSAPSQSSSESSSRSALPDAPGVQSSTIRKMLAAQLTGQASRAGATVRAPAFTLHFCHAGPTPLSLFRPAFIAGRRVAAVGRSRG